MPTSKSVTSLRERTKEVEEDEAQTILVVWKLKKQFKDITKTYNASYKRQWYFRSQIG